jgi:hypothetical protein
MPSGTYVGGTDPTPHSTRIQRLGAVVPTTVRGVVESLLMARVPDRTWPRADANALLIAIDEVGFRERTLRFLPWKITTIWCPASTMARLVFGSSSA